MTLQHLHHATYPCRDAKHTVLWYQQMLKMALLYVLPAQAVPRSDVPDPGIQVFLDAGEGTVLSFVELAGQVAPAQDRTATAWTQHISLQAAGHASWLSLREHLMAQGVTLLGESDQGFFQALHFADLNGHRVEVTCLDPHADQQLRQLHEARWEMLDAWAATHKMPSHPALLNPSAFAETVEMELKP